MPLNRRNNEEREEKEKPLPKNRYTRCPECVSLLSYTDRDNPDEVIDDHLWTCWKRGGLSTKDAPRQPEKPLRSLEEVLAE